MNSAGENKFYIPSIRFEGEKVWYYPDDIKCIIPEPLPITSSARHFSVAADIWAKHTKRNVFKTRVCVCGGGGGTFVKFFASEVLVK